jgi:hypothetical protein
MAKQDKLNDLIFAWICDPAAFLNNEDACKQQIADFFESKKTPYKDDNDQDISGGTLLKISANPHFGKFTVKFGEYNQQNPSRNGRQKLHCGWYLCNGKRQTSLADVMHQPTGFGSSKHSILIVKAKK